MQRSRAYASLALLASLAACSGGSSVTPTTATGASSSNGGSASNAAIPNAHDVTADDATHVARKERDFLKLLDVRPSSLAFTTTASKTIAVKTGYATIVFAGSSDDAVATIEPKAQFVQNWSGGTATFTVTPKANGKATLGFLTTLLDGGRVPVTVAFGGGPTPTPVPTAKPTAGPTATPTAKPTAPPTATPKPTASPTPKPTATPTVAPTTKPTATPTPAGCAAPPPDPVTATLTLTGAVQSVTLPCYKDTKIVATIPANNSTAASPITVAVAVSDDQSLGAKATPAAGETVIGYTSLSPSATVNFTPSTATIATSFSSPSLITAGHTYRFEVQVTEFGDAVIQSGSATLSGDTLSFGVAPPGGSFNGGLHAVVVLYKK